jgi:methionyl-tRNA synthetase
MKGIAEKNMDAMEFSVALGDIWTLIRRSNKYIDETMPWALAKDENRRERLGTVLYCLAESLRFVSVLVSPVMTKAPALIRAQLGLDESEAYAGWESLSTFGAIPANTRVGEPQPLFPRMDVEKELAELESLIPGGSAESKKALEKPIEHKPEITIDDFAKVELRTATVTAAEKVEKADKLLKLTLSLGSETRQVVSGIAQYYAHEEMVGKRVVLVANLKPAKLRGIMSEGMILCAEDSEGNLKLITPEGDMPDGAEVR